MFQNRIVIIGAGAAGFFGAINAARANPKKEVILLEKTLQPLAKVRISGGGRCNVTHACFDPKELVRFYPRGSKALLGPFHRFGPKDTISWFQSCGVKLKTEEDGRMFPVTDSSETIISCLREEARKAGVQVRTQVEVVNIHKENHFILQLGDTTTLECDHLLLATGSSKKGHELAKLFGHKITDLAPSLFTFNIQDPRLEGIPGISVPAASLKILETSLEERGPLLITHWGLSGPAILKLSAWGARTLQEMQYRATLQVNWVGHKGDDVKADLLKMRQSASRDSIYSLNSFGIPKNLWKKLLFAAKIPEGRLFAQLSNKEVDSLAMELTQARFQIVGKSTYKDEFVTCGGVALDEVDFRTMESRLCEGLYFAGEILDVDAVTGGFNFQNAWTTSWIAGNSMV